MSASASATVRVMSAEEIAARSGGDVRRLVFPERGSLYAERAMRLRQLAAGHAMGDYLVFISMLAQAQQAALDELARSSGWAVPDAQAIDRASREGRPPLAASDWPRDERWHRVVLQGIVGELQRSVGPGPVADMLDRLAAADDVYLERQADALLTGVMAGLDLASAPVVAAALQVTWTHLACQLGEAPLGLLDDAGVCPCCGSRPVASITRSSGESTGQRFLHCSLCNVEWYLERVRCSHCGKTEHVAYQSLDRAERHPQADDMRRPPPEGDEQSGKATFAHEAESEAASGERAAKAAVQVETCDDCGHYLKIVHTDREPFVEPVADDLASLTLDLLVSETGLQRHGVNLMLLFGAPESTAPPPEPA